MHQKTNKQTGFTIVELTLAMAFVSVLLIVIALTVIQIINIYNKGMTMKEVNQAGRAISADIRRTLSQSQPFVVNDDTHFCLQLNSTSPCKSSVSGAKGGRLCTGVYSYIWNYDSNAPVNKYKNASSQEAVRFVRVRDISGKYCASPQLPVDNTVAKDSAESPVELLSSNGVSGSAVILHNLTIKKVTSNSSVGEALYSLSMVIGTDELDAINTVDASCKPPSTSGGLQNFCAVNQFDFTALAGNKGGSI